MIRLVLLLSMTLCGAVHAQAVGSCRTGRAQGALETVYLQASVFNTGGLFFGGSTTSGDGYLAPRVDGTSPVFAANLWLGGIVDSELRVAAARYGNYNFWPGPLLDAGAPPADCSAHDRIFEVSRQDVARYLNTGEASDDLRDWPADLGAPVIDGDGVAGNYDLAAGDQPALRGDVNVWWVMNDAGNVHPSGESTAPLGVEVRVFGFAFADARDRDLNRATFFRYEIVNRGDESIEAMHASIFSDPDLGDAGDDYIGTDTLRNMGFVYNNSDEDSVYGEAPPAWGIQVLQGPIVGRDTLGATATSTFVSGGPDGTQDPGTAEQYYNYMQGLWGGGMPVTARGSGFQTDGPVTPFFFAGDVPSESFWSEVNVDGTGRNNYPGDRRLVVSTGPFTLAAGASTTLAFATPFARGTSYLDSVAELYAVADEFEARYAASGFEARFVEAREWAEYREVTPEPTITLSRVHPNPSTAGAGARLTLPAAASVRADVLDALGRVVATVADGRLPEGENVLAVPRGLPPGAYRIRVEVEAAGVDLLPFTIVR